MDFSSDTSAPAHPAVFEALTAAGTGNAPSYGGDVTTQAATRLLRDLFEADLDAVFTVSGTASNALALSVLCSPVGSVLCHDMAHIARDERGAPEFFTGGGKLQLLTGADGKVDAASLRDALAARDPGFVHETPAEALSLTNLTESGTAYEPDDIAALAELAKAGGLSVHLDGARLANALVTTRAAPADMSWRAGVDVVTLGLTKTGAMGCEIICLFGEARRKLPELLARTKRAGHLAPKTRFVSAQAVALLESGLWLDLAATANRRAQRLASVFELVEGARLSAPVQGNEVFVDLPDAVAKRLKDAGAAFYPWPDGSYRFVCAWSTSDNAIEALRTVVVEDLVRD